MPDVRTPGARGAGQRGGDAPVGVAHGLRRLADRRQGRGLRPQPPLHQAAHGRAETEAGLELLASHTASGLSNSGRRRTVGADKGYDGKPFVTPCRRVRITPHVAPRKRGSAIDGRTTRHPGYGESQVRRKKVEQPFGWMKAFGGLRKLRHRGRAKVRWQFVFTAAVYNLVLMTRLLAAPV